MPLPDGTLRRLGEMVGLWALRRFGQRLPHRLRFNLMYLGAPPWDTGVTPPELTAFIERHPPGRAIDLGCGTGTNLAALGRSGWQVTGVDFARRAVREARRRLDRAGIAGEVRYGDVSRPEVVAGEYDLVLDIGCYHGLPQAARAAYRQNLDRILAPGGHFLIYAHCQLPGESGGAGITAREADLLVGTRVLVERQDSQDRWGRPTMWMCCWAS